MLIVIALLGALAVGLLATIDPFEQLKKGRDTSKRNTVSEIYNASLRFYSTKGDFPWNPVGSPLTTLTSVALDTLSGDVQQMVDAGELKTRFWSLAGMQTLTSILVTSTSRDHIAVCYVPESKGFQEDLNTTYNADGTVNTETAGATACKANIATGGTDCFFCVQ